MVRSIVEITSMTFQPFFPARRAIHCHSWSVFFLTSECTFGDFELVSKSLFRSIGYQSRIYSNPAGAQIDAAQPPNCLVSKIISRFVKRFIGKAAHYSMLSKQQALEGRMWYTYMTVVCYVKRANLTLDIFAQCKLVHFLPVYSSAAMVFFRPTSIFLFISSAVWQITGSLTNFLSKDLSSVRLLSD